MNFETLVAICQYAFIGFFVLLGIAATVPKMSRSARVIAGVAVCLTVFAEWFYSTAPETAYRNHVVQEQEKGTP